MTINLSLFALIFYHLFSILLSCQKIPPTVTNNRIERDLRFQAFDTIL